MAIKKASFKKAAKEAARKDVTKKAIPKKSATTKTTQKAVKKIKPKTSSKKSILRKNNKIDITVQNLESKYLNPENIKDRVEESKYYSGPIIQKIENESHPDIPTGYQDNRIVLMVRDPYWLYVYWEINENKVKEISYELGAKFQSASLILRVYDVSDWSFFDIGVQGLLNNWYINVGRPNTSFCVDVGYLTLDGCFICAARSNIVKTPRDRMSDVIDEEWMIPDWDMMYALSGGFGRGLGSFEIKEMMEKRQWRAPSSWLFSGSPIKKQKERPFWLVVNCELIVYGATEPTASLSVQGRPVKLRNDGTFSLRFALPDGKQIIPVEAVRDDGLEKRKITPEVYRRTK